MQIVIIGIVIGTTVLALILRTNWQIRMLPVGLIAILALVHVNVLQSAALMAKRYEQQRTGQKLSNEWLAGAEATNVFIRKEQRVSITMLGCLMILALVPTMKKQKSQPAAGGYSPEAGEKPQP